MGDGAALRPHRDVVAAQQSRDVGVGVERRESLLGRCVHARAERAAAANRDVMLVQGAQDLVLRGVGLVRRGELRMRSPSTANRMHCDLRSKVTRHFGLGIIRESEQSMK